MNDDSSCASVATCEWHGSYCSVKDVDAYKRCPAVMSGRGLICTHGEVRTDMEPCGSSDCSDTVSLENVVSQCAMTLWLLED